MKALLVSDIHSNILALEAIWARESDSDVILCAGDLVDYGPYPREVIQWVREHGAICVQGNHDLWVAMAYRAGGLPEIDAPEEREWRQHNAALLGADEIAFLEGLPRAVEVEMDGVRYGMTHMYEGYEIIRSMHAFNRFGAELFPEATPGSVRRLIMGHTHRQEIHYLRDDVFWLNPGSVSYRRPDDPDQTAHYATITDGKIALKQLAYDMAPLYRQAQDLPLRDNERKVALVFWGPRMDENTTS